LGFWVCGLGFGVWGWGLGVWGWGFGVGGLGIGVEVLGNETPPPPPDCRISDSMCRVEGTVSGAFWVEGVISRIWGQSFGHSPTLNLEADSSTRYGGWGLTRLVIYCQTTSVSAENATHCATYCTPCRPLIRAFSGWIRTPRGRGFARAALGFEPAALGFERAALGFEPAAILNELTRDIEKEI
jgi:hypothetical protein